MNNIVIKSIAALIAVVALGAIALTFIQAQNVRGEAYSSSCTASTSQVSVGLQPFGTLVNAAANRAYLRIQQPDNATNTVYLNLGTTAATQNNADAILEKVSATGTEKIFNTGLNADLPYTGPITAIVGAGGGSSTVLVTDCLY